MLPFAATWINLEIIILSKVCQTEEDEYHMISHRWNLKINANELMYKTETHHRHRRQAYVYQRGKRGEEG